MTAPSPAARHVAVIGAGIVGVSTALALIDDGHAVTLVEPSVPGGPQAASYGNGAYLSPASVIPMSVPGLWRKVPGYLLDRNGPLTIRWPYLPQLAPWLRRFLAAGRTVAQVEATARALATLLHDAPARHAALAEAAGRPDLIRRDGLLYAYPGRADFAADAFAWRLRQASGVAWEEIEGDALAEIEPALGPRYRFGVLVPSGGHCLDPGAHVAALAALAVARGARQVAARATGFQLGDGRLKAVETDAGPVPCDAAVIACGIRAKALAAAAGDAVPLESERGYHVEIADPPVRLRRPVMPVDGKMGNTLTLGGLRAAGQVELASPDAPPDWRRADILLRQLLETYPGLGDPARLAVRRWQGNRPSTPDGLPVIGHATASPDIVHAFGHGHVGLASGPVSGRLAADLISDRPPVIPPEPFSAARFR